MKHDPSTPLSDDERAKLLAKRAKIEDDVRALAAQPTPRSNAGVLGRQEDLLALAKKIKAIDKKLGRNDQYA